MKAQSENDKLIVALDVDTLAEARELVDILSPEVNIFKVGSQLFTACGPAAVRFILARGKKVFLDLKYHDIPNTVANSVRTAVNLSEALYAAPDDKNSNQGQTASIFMYTVHITGGKEMLKRACEETEKQAKKTGVKKPYVLGITVLTSEAQGDNIQKLVLERALNAKEAGLDGVVASTREASIIRKELGKDFIIVTPGIRLPDSKADDQKRIATPAEAIAMGSDFLVVGRPIVKSPDPLESAKKILKEIK